MSGDGRVVVLASMLAQGRTVHVTAAVFTLGGWGLVGAERWPVLIVLAVVFAAETWFAARVGLDAELFTAIARGTSPDTVDEGLLGYRLIRERVTERDLSDRLDGAARLWRRQLGLAALQALLSALALGWRACS